MKAFITLAVVCLIAGAFADLELTEEQKAKVKVHFDECAKQEKVTEEEATKLRNKDYSNPTPGMKCFGTCFFEKIGALKDGTIQESVVLEKLSPHYSEDKIKAAIDKCKVIKGDDRCDTGFKIFECFEKAKAELGN